MDKRSLPQTAEGGTLRPSSVLFRSGRLPDAKVVDFESMSDTELNEMYDLLLWEHNDMVATVKCENELRARKNEMQTQEYRDITTWLEAFIDG